MTMLDDPRRKTQAARSCGRRCFRAGISLLEVLISIGVLAVGLMGVAALIPAAGFQAKEGARNERLAHVGKRVFREIDVRGLLEMSSDGTFQNLMFHYGVPLQPPFEKLRPPTAGVTAHSFCIDPLVTSPNVSNNAPGSVPDYSSNSGFRRTLPIVAPEDTLFSLSPGTVRTAFPNLPMAGMATFQRVALNVDPTSLVGVQSNDRFAASVAVVGDSLDFTVPKAKQLSPQQNFVTVLQGAPATKVNLLRNNESNLSWMIFCQPNTLSPIVDLQAATFAVSLVLFENRTTYDREYAGIVTASDLANKGRDVTIRFPNMTNLDTKKKFAKTLKRNSWIALGWQSPVNGNMFYQWYGIESVIEIAQANANIEIRRLGLKGPDWPYPAGTIYAVFVPRVAAVYTKVMPAKVR